MPIQTDDMPDLREATDRNCQLIGVAEIGGKRAIICSPLGCTDVFPLTRDMAQALVDDLVEAIAHCDEGDALTVEMSSVRERRDSEGKVSRTSTGPTVRMDI